MTDDQLTDEQIEQMREVCEDTSEASGGGWILKQPENSIHLKVWKPDPLGQTDDLFCLFQHDDMEGGGVYCPEPADAHHIATFDPPTVRKLLDAAEERNRLREEREYVAQESVDQLEDACRKALDDVGMGRRDWTAGEALERIESRLHNALEGENYE